MDTILRNYINGQWTESHSAKYFPVINPATTRKLAKVPAGCLQDVEEGANAASLSAVTWQTTPVNQRIQYLHKMKQLLESHIDELAEICTNESGKTFVESKEEIILATEHLEMACSVPLLIQGRYAEGVASGIDEFIIRQPIGVGACITPFNFPVLIAFSFFPYALVCGNTYLVKPSEKVPMTITRIFELFETLELPKGVLSLIHGGKDTVNAILNHPSVNAISFVGSNAIANYVYKLGTTNGKRMQVHGGVKNYIVVLPDADIHTTVSAVADNAFCFAGQHCQAVSTVILVNEAFEHITPKLIEAAQAKKCGYGMDPSAEVGPVISNESRKRIKELIQQGIDEGAELLLDGRVVTVKGFEDGYFIKPTILSNIKQDSTLHTTEIIGPVLGLIQVETLEEAIKLINSRDCENSASLFTQNGVAARKFRYDILAKNVGINMGIAAPIPITTFGSRKDLFLVALHQQANQTIDFYTQTKLVKERWQTE